MESKLSCMRHLVSDSKRHAKKDSQRSSDSALVSTTRQDLWLPQKDLLVLTFRWVSRPITQLRHLSSTDGSLNCTKMYRSRPNDSPISQSGMGIQSHLWKWCTVVTTNWQSHQ